MPLATSRVRFVSYPFAPMPAPRPRFGKHGAYSNSKRYAAWKNDVRDLWMEPMLKGRCKVHVHLREWRSNSDLDNVLKAVLDALAGTAFEDDSAKFVVMAAISHSPASQKDGGFTVSVLEPDELICL